LGVYGEGVSLIIEGSRWLLALVDLSVEVISHYKNITLATHGLGVGMKVAV